MGHHRFDDDAVYEEPEQGPGRRRGLSIVAVVVALAVLGSGLAFLWNGYGGAIGVPSVGSSKATDAGPAQPSLADLVRELQKTEQQSAAQTQLLASQQAEIKNLSAQVAALAAKVDALQALAAAPVQAVKQAAPGRKKSAPAATNTAGPQPLSPAPVQLAPGADRQ